MDADILLEDIDLFVGGTHALCRFSWRTDPGQNWAILGPNGSGKSSLIKLLAGQLYPVAKPESQFLFFGRDRMRPGVNIWEIRRSIGIVSPELQSTYLPEWTGLDVVLSGFFSSNGVYDTVSASQRAAAHAALDRMQATHLAQRPIGAVSYGEARRLIIARALIHNPSMLVFDEPTNGLDPGSAEDFLATIEELGETGLSILIVTHHIHEILPSITHVVILKSGRVHHSGPKSNILTADVLHDTFGTRFNLVQDNGRYWTVPESTP
jgi:iron complex transport system ATP-binding protein